MVLCKWALPREVKTVGTLTLCVNGNRKLGRKSMLMSEVGESDHWTLM